MHRTFVAAAIAAVVLAFTAHTATAGTFETLHSFCVERSCKDGASPTHKLAMDSSGALYGVAPHRGAHNGGTVFKLTQADGNKWETRVLYSFCALHACADGLAPATSLIVDKDGSLYGVASHGGGTVFKFDGRALTTIHVFCPRAGCLDGEKPTGGVLLDASGNLYGTTPVGGKSHVAGAAYRLAP